MLAFSKEEYQERLKKVQASMESKGIELLLISDPANICYLTGLDSWSFYVHQMLVVPIDEDQPYAILRKIDCAAARHTTWLDDAHLIDYPDYLVHNPVDHMTDFACDFINKHGFADNKTVAVEKDIWWFTAMSGEHINAGLSNAKAIVDSGLLVNWVKAVKSDAEIEVMRKAAKITEKIFDAVYEHIRPGVRECDAAAEVYKAGIKGTDEYGGEFCAMMPFMACGDRSDACHLPWTSEPYKEGQVLMFEWAGVYKRYHHPTCRTIVIGKPKYESMIETSKIVVEALNAALEVAKPGEPVSAIPAACAKVYEKYGIEIVSPVRNGYSVGLNFPPDWAERTISLRDSDETILQKGMTFHLRSDNLGFAPIPGEDPYGIHFSEGIAITENGCEPLAHIKRELHIAK